MDLRALSPPNNTVPEQQLNSLMRSDQARLFMNALILLRYLTCVFSHSSLARRECAEIIDYTYENCREQRFTGVLAPMNSDSHNQRCQFVTAGESFCQHSPNVTYTSWLGLSLLSLRNVKRGMSKYLISQLRVSSTSLLHPCAVFLQRPGEALWLPHSTYVSTLQQ